jgi:hypothetical protein
LKNPAAGCEALIIFSIMGTPQRPAPVKLFVGIMYDEQLEIGRVLQQLEKKFGQAELLYGPVPFSWTDYYAPEMGDRLIKMYICYTGLIDRGQLPAIKLWTNALEQDYAAGNRRKVNIDPGYVARDKLVLATTKDFYHRLYLGKGIYGEVTLHFQKGIFRHFSWTYPDYKDEGVQNFLITARAGLVGKIRKE